MIVITQTFEGQTVLVYYASCLLDESTRETKGGANSLSKKKLRNRRWRYDEIRGTIVMYSLESLSGSGWREREGGGG